MHNDTRAPIEPRANRSPGRLNLGVAALPVDVLMTSVLLDVLTLVEQNSAQARSHARSAADLLTFALGESVISTLPQMLDFLHAPADDTDATRRFVLDGALIAVYLLDVAARRAAVEEQNSSGALAMALPTGLSLLGLALISARNGFQRLFSGA